MPRLELQNNHVSTEIPKEIGINVCFCLYKFVLI